ncbi:MAG: HAD-IA family hydrolase [Candidatus Bathyarchaeota archaeon]|nr:HAD-IA family hydrolase [Candidatus Bathyarchaeota archaeon]
MPTLSINGNTIECNLAIFDMDGTIIDVKHRIETMGKVRAEIMKKTVGDNATELWAKASGIDLKTGRVRLDFALANAPRREDLIVAATVIAINGEKWIEAKKIAEQIYTEADNVLASTYKPILLPGVQTTLRSLKDAGVKLALATNAPNISAENVMKSVNLKEIFKIIIGTDDVVNPKPAPDMILLACERCGCKPSETIYVGDMPMDMIAGRKAARAIGIFRL